MIQAQELDGQGNLVQSTAGQQQQQQQQRHPQLCLQPGSQ
jgi:hypothetical protein